MSKKTNVMVSVLLVILGTFLGVLGTTLVNNFSPTLENKTRDFSKADFLMDVIKDYAYYYVNEEELFEGAYRGIMESLGDPYSTYYTAWELENLGAEISSSYAGMGVYISQNGGYPLVTSVIPGSPAYKAGIEPGFTIIMIDDRDIKNFPLPEISRLIKGVNNTIRKISVMSDDLAEIRNIFISLTQLNIPTISFRINKINNKSIGYIKIEQFSALTYQEFLSAMNEIERNNIDSLIVDVRDNPGGLLVSVTDILDFFINSSEPFMFEVDRNGHFESFYLNKNDHVINYDIAVLINNNSASAAEVFASAMNELCGYPLYGTTTFGKGIVQVPLYFEEGDAIKLTTYRWLTPNKTWIQGTGIEPTFEVNMVNADLSYIDNTKEYMYDVVDNEIADIQKFLSIICDVNIRTDGYYDNVTLDTIKSYQLSKELPATGIVDTKTAYWINLDLIEYLFDETNDEQLQYALERLTT